ncbi:MAG TPA: M23 family metallopeptidase [Polyangia bacterium]|nr:M23 family metallopeptidase [Polyangia bacterium]
MYDASDTIDSSMACGLCEGDLSLGRYVEVVHGSVLVTFCSATCARAARRARRALRWAARRRSIRQMVVLTVALVGWLTPHEGPASKASHHHPLVPPATARAVEPPGPEVLPPGWYGPEWPPTDASLLESLGRDAWVHPLAGPIRRMPRVDSRVFGADRPGNRPIECRNGHCGVDLGGEIYGEHVHAVHDGIVDYIQRGANPDRGGRFVRLSHRNGTLFTQYFHLAAIPRGLQRGMHVKAGDVIGLLGDSGVKESAPHLHFALSIRMPKDSGERYIDPEPLVALWPLRVPVDGSEVGLYTILADTGIPLGSAVLHAGHKRAGATKPGRAPRGGGPPASSATDDSGSADAPVEAPPPEAAGDE